MFGKVVMPVTLDKPLLSEEELAALMQEDPNEWNEQAGKSLVQTEAIRQDNDAGKAADEELAELRDTVRQLYVRIEFLENLFREHVQACGNAFQAGSSAVRRSPGRPDRESDRQELAPETFPPRKNRHKRRKTSI